MTSLLSRAKNIIKTFNIDNDKVYEIKNLNAKFNKNEIVVGTVIKYVGDTDVSVIAIMLVSGWKREWICKNNFDVVRITRDLKRNGFTEYQISQILGDIKMHKRGDE